MKILVTGGAGYIGSHTCIELLKAGHEVVILDNLCNAKEKAVKRTEQIAGTKIPFYKADLLDIVATREVFEKEKPHAVIHFAGLKAVGESVIKPLEYYNNNLCSTLNLLTVMRENGVKNLVFSSSATVYGVPKSVPIKEDFPLSTTNPYGTTKLMIERILTDFQAANNDFSIVLLRYFNPIGAHESGLIGEDPNGIPNNLVPYIARVAIGKLEKIHVYGNDYPTPDGTGVRDYIHVVDLAVGHVKALAKADNPGLFIYNLGTGIGYSVLDVIHAYEKACGKELPYEINARRPGDIAQCYADAGKAFEELGFKAEYDLAKMCEDSWRWQKNNPNGFDD